jgi:hypothetical protein
VLVRALFAFAQSVACSPFAQVRGLFACAQVRGLFGFAQVRGLFGFAQVRGLFGFAQVRGSTTDKKSPAVDRRGCEKALMVTENSVAQLDRPAEAGMMVPVVVRDAKHLL